MTRPGPLLFAAFAASVLLYVDRYCISMAGVYIRDDLGLSDVQLGWVLSAFFWAYAFAQVPSGWLADRFGPRRMLTVYVVAWSALTAATSLATGLLTLVLARLLFGLAQAGCYPASATLIGAWVSERRRGLASSFVALGGRLGGAAAPLLTALVMVMFVPPSVPSTVAASDILRVDLLRAASATNDSALTTALRPRLGEMPADAEGAAARLNVLIGDSTLLDGVAIAPGALPREAEATLARSPESRTPAEAARLNRLALEAAFPGAIQRVYGAGWRPMLLLFGVAGLPVALLVWLAVRDRPAGSGAPPASAVESPPWAALSRDGNQWLYSEMQFGVCLGWTFMVTLMPAYLVDHYGVPLETLGAMGGLPLLLGCVGMALGGWGTDWATRRLGPRWGRSLPMGAPLALGAAAFAACLWPVGAWGVVLLMAAVAVATDITVAACWAFAVDTGGRHAGSVMGWGNMWGNLGSAVSPVVLAAVKTWAGWDAVFVTCALAFAGATAAGLLLDARRRLTA